MNSLCCRPRCSPSAKFAGHFALNTLISPLVGILKVITSLISIIICAIGLLCHTCSEKKESDIIFGQDILADRLKSDLKDSVKNLGLALVRILTITYPFQALWVLNNKKLLRSDEIIFWKDRIKALP